MTPSDQINSYEQAWSGDTDHRLGFHVHTVDPLGEKIGLHVHLVGSGSPSFSITLTAADAATLAGVLRDAADVAVGNEP